LSDTFVQNLNLSKYNDEEEEKLKEANVTKEGEQEQPLNINQKERIPP